MELDPHQSTYQPKTSLSRLSLFGSLLAMVAFISLSQLGKLDDNQYQANIFTKVDQSLVTDLENGIQNNNQIVLNNILGLNNPLQQELDQITNISDLNIVATDLGLLISFLGSTSGNSLHPYYGLLKLNDAKNKVDKTHWGEAVTAEKITLEHLTNSNAVNIILKNNGYMPWLVSDIWRDLESGQKIELIAKDEAQTVILPGQSAAFVLPNLNSSIINVTRGFELITNSGL